MGSAHGIAKNENMNSGGLFCFSEDHNDFETERLLSVLGNIKSLTISTLYSGSTMKIYVQRGNQYVFKKPFVSDCFSLYQYSRTVEIP